MLLSVVHDCNKMGRSKLFRTIKTHFVVVVVVVVVFVVVVVVMFVISKA